MAIYYFTYTDMHTRFGRISTHLRLLTAAFMVAASGLGVLQVAPASAAGNASFSLSPAKGSATGSQTLDVTIHADSGDVAVNAVEPELLYDPAQLQVKSVDGTGSAYDVAAPVSNKDGSLRIPRGKATPGLTGRQKVAAVQFRVIGASPSASLTFGKASAILTLDGASNVWNGQAAGGTYELSQPAERTDEPAANSKAFPVAVLVKDKQGISVEGASVTLGDGRTATTDAKGVAGFSGVPEGKYEAVVSKGDSTETRTVTVQEGDAAEVQEHAFTLAADEAKSLSVPYTLIAILLALLAGAVFAAWRWHKRIVAHHLDKQAAAGTEKR